MLKIHKIVIPEGYCIGLIGNAAPMESLAAIVFHSTKRIKTCCDGVSYKSDEVDSIPPRTLHRG